MKPAPPEKSERKNRKTFWHRRAFARVAAGVLLPGFSAWVALHFVPIPPALLRVPEPSVAFTDRNREPLRELLVDNARFARSVPLDEIPRALIDATVAAEDRRFWKHAGVDVFAMVRAVSGLVTRHRVVSGASTITQQLVKIAEPRPRTIFVKISEAIIALRLEQTWSKRQIIGAYLNRLDYGNLRIGCAPATQYYFGKPPADLSVAECAFLAGLPQAPARMNPYVHFERAKKRQEWVLGQMRRNGLLGEADYRRALEEKLRLCAPRRIFKAPHFVDLVMQQQRENGGGRTQGGELRTTLDLELTRVVENCLRERIGRLRDQHVRNGAVVVIDNRTGGVLALVGSENYFAPGAGQVNGAWARRSPGSALKPFTYLLAFERGATPASIVADLPAEFATTSGIYRPENFNRRCYGPMRYRLALANSLNISAVKVLNSIGGAGVLQKRLQECGLTTLEKSADHYGLGLTIGNAEARLLELTNAYACLARLGEYKPYRLLQNRIAETGNRKDFQQSSVCDPGAAWLIADILSDNFARSLAFGLNSSLRFDFRVACKTGTSTDFRDNWAMGYTPEFTIGVWVGNFDGTPMEHVSGVTGAAPILHEVFEFLHRRHGTTWFDPPVEMVERAVHPVTGKLVANPTADMPREKFAAGRLPPAESAEDYDEQGRARLGVEYAAWFGSGANGIAGSAVIDERAGPRKLRVVSPLPGTTCVLDPDLPGRGARLPLAALGARGAVWKCDTLELREEDGKTIAILTEGRHEITLVDSETGETQRTWIMVKSL